MTIVIKTDADLTPPGKRTARVIQTSRGGRQLRWYVAGEIYHRLTPSAENIELTNVWMNAGTGDGNGFRGHIPKTPGSPAIKPNKQ